MTDEQIKRFIELYPNSDIARAYRLGRKEQLVSMQPEIYKAMLRK